MSSAANHGTDTPTTMGATGHSLLPPPPPHFLRLCRDLGIFVASKYQGSDTLYAPLPSEDVLVAAGRYDEVTFAAFEQCFFADEEGRYSHTRPAYVINFWRYSEAADGMRVVRSIAFQNESVFMQVSSEGCVRYRVRL
jgi:hypothetical protein